MDDVLQLVAKIVREQNDLDDLWEEMEDKFGMIHNLLFLLRFKIQRTVCQLRLYLCVFFRYMLKCIFIAANQPGAILAPTGPLRETF